MNYSDSLIRSKETSPRQIKKQNTMEQANNQTTYSALQLNNGLNQDQKRATVKTLGSNNGRQVGLNNSSHSRSKCNRVFDYPGLSRLGA